MRNLIMAGLGSLVIAGSLLVAAPAQAFTEHCDSSTFPNKVEASGDSASVYTGLPVGTYVCLKVATRVTFTSVDYNGYVTNSEILNQNGKAQAISYYAWGASQPS